MKNAATFPHVGPPDPERNTSPIFDAPDDALPSLDLEIETGACFYNGVRYAIGQYIAADGEILHCEERGIWVRKDAR